MRIWREANAQRIVMTSDGPLVVYEGDYVMVVVGQSLEQCREVLCPMLRDEEKK
jgi:hypothetical protein